MSDVAASGRHMWQSFDLDDFVRAVDAAIATRAAVDRDQVFVIGHSGAGCNPDGGCQALKRTPATDCP